jgi:hypothetical protein
MRVLLQQYHQLHLVKKHLDDFVFDMAEDS